MVMPTPMVSIARLMAAHRPYTRLGAMLLFTDADTGANQIPDGPAHRRQGVRVGMAMTNEIVSAVDESWTNVTARFDIHDQISHAVRACNVHGVEALGGFVIGRTAHVDPRWVRCVYDEAKLWWDSEERVAVWPENGTEWVPPTWTKNPHDAEPLVDDRSHDQPPISPPWPSTPGEPRQRALTQAYLDDVLKAVGGANTFG